VRTIRWPIAILITVAVAIGYLDRQALTLTWPAMQRDIALSDADFGNLQSLFYLAYALMYVGGGRLMDLLGSRRGFLLIVVWWSLAIAGHGLAGGLLMLGAARLMLGLAQGGTFPGAAKAVAEWFPARERATAMGMANGGSSVGAVLAPPAVAAVLCYAPWPWVYYLSGAIGLLWTAWWLWDYYPPAQHPRLAAEERREIDEVLVSAVGAKSSVSWWRLLVVPEVWGMVLGKACCDAVWFTYIAWMLKYLVDMRGFTNAQTGSIAWIPYAASGVGSLVGGWCSSRLLRSGFSLNFSRKVVLGACAAVMPCTCLVTHVPVHAEIVLFSIAFFAHLSFSTLVITLPADLFPRGIVGSVAGLVGFGGSMGGMFFNKFAGTLMTDGTFFNKFAGSLFHGAGRQAGYPMLFAIGGTFHVLGFLWILLTIRNVRPVAPCEEVMAKA
jgi:ACS family hexuronate transporter-like MFS transporter